MHTQRMKRRQFIKLASGLLAAPFASLTGGVAAAQANISPLRLLTLVESYGIPTSTRRDIWVSSTTGDYPLSGNELGTILTPLAAYKDNLLVCTGNNMDSLSTTGNSRTHHHMAMHTLAASAAIQGANANAKIKHESIDYRIAQYLNNERGLGRVFPHLFFTNVSQPNDTTFCYNESGDQIRSMANPINQANAIFSTDASIVNAQFQNDTQQSIFSLVHDQVVALRGQLNSASSSEVIDAYQYSVNDLADQIQRGSEKVCGYPSNFSGYPTTSLAQSTVSTPAIFQNIKQAFACDLTSSLTYAIGGEKINQLKHGSLYSASEHNDATVNSLLSKNQHAMSHQVSEAADKSHEVVKVHHMEELASLLDELSVTPDSDGNSLLDNTVVFATSAMANNTHSKNDYCQLIVAGKNTNFRGGYHYDLSGHTNNDLLTTLAQGMGLPDDSFGGHNKSGNYIASLNNGPITKMLLS